jgi:hypothetical protein
MIEKRCPYCHKSFIASRCQPSQTVCGQVECQRRRRSNYRRKKVASDPKYREACRQSARQWRKEHPDYWKQYRHAHPESIERNRQQQKSRDCKQRLKTLANNIPASSLKLCPATVLVLGPQLHALANNTSAPVQLWILEAVPPLNQAACNLANNTPLAP